MLNFHLSELWTIIPAVYQPPGLCYSFCYSCIYGLKHSSVEWDHEPKMLGLFYVPKTKDSVAVLLKGPFNFSCFQEHIHVNRAFSTHAIVLTYFCAVSAPLNTCHWTFCYAQLDWNQWCFGRCWSKEHWVFSKTERLMAASGRCKILSWGDISANLLEDDPFISRKHQITLEVPEAAHLWRIGETTPVWEARWFPLWLYSFPRDLQSRP